MGAGRQAGFTLTELMVTIAIAAILLTIGLPSFQATIRSNRVSTANNEMVASIAMARSEAMRNKRGAAICAAAGANACGNDWNNGWLVWADRNADRTLDAGETVVRYVQPHTHLTLQADNGGAALGFDSRGAAASAVSFTLQPTDCPAGHEVVNTIAMNGSGQVKTRKSACP